MSLNTTPSGERIHIGLFGRTNAGKSSLFNAITGQNVSIVSDKKGTTTDPVYKAMELLPLGPVLLIDTPGYDDAGKLGALRMNKTMEVLGKTDIAVLVVDAASGIQQTEEQLRALFLERQIPFLIVYNQCDGTENLPEANGENVIFADAKNPESIFALKERLARMMPDQEKRKFLAADLIKPEGWVVLVIPIDGAAPKGRLILPQQQVLRELLEAGVLTVSVRECELETALEKLNFNISLVITDSQVFSKVAEIVPKEIPLTSFSILMARYKGFLETALRGADAIDRLHDGDVVLISEGCTHHRQCEDIGTVKIPRWFQEYTKKNLVFETSSGREFPQDLTGYSLIVHCGGCMLNEREMCRRMKLAENAGVPFTNYGIAIAKMKGILERSIEILKEKINEGFTDRLK